MICINNQWIRNGTHIEMLESKDKSEPLLLNGGVTSLMFIQFSWKIANGMLHTSLISLEKYSSRTCVTCINSKQKQRWKIRISERYEGGTTTCLTICPSSAAAAFDGLHFLINTPSSTKYPWDTHSSCSTGTTASKRDDIFSSFLCSTISCSRDRDNLSSPIECSSPFLMAMLKLVSFSLWHSASDSARRKYLWVFLN